jgi:hypothetical protein
MGLRAGILTDDKILPGINTLGSDNMSGIEVDIVIEDTKLDI